ncbi:hypothetical protein FN846DRAFT_952860 [Sphaerosporella brunnea]|uniref:Uncharacterized protein n=1 Tax=Sphaerosporella brunnea TaxID=1250544 RepID=A0A5J5EUB3_9PEZI|nr:hypothetical protein FN846DRAFT_952860 [Sphaerosporella brunnea]
MNSSCQSPLQKRLLGSTPLFSYHRPHPPQAPSQQCFSSRRSTRTTKPTPALGPSTSASKSSRPAARGTRAQKPAAPKAASRRSGGRPSWPWLTSQATFVSTHSLLLYFTDGVPRVPADPKARLLWRAQWEVVRQINAWKLFKYQAEAEMEKVAENKDDEAYMADDDEKGEEAEEEKEEEKEA